MATTMRKVKGLVAAFIALCFALTALPVAAHAAYATQTGDITITDVSPEDEVKIYKVVDYDYSVEGNTVTWTFTHEFSIDRNAYAAAEDNSTAMKGYADQIMDAAHEAGARGG